MRYLSLLVLMIILTGPLYAQDIPDDPKTPPTKPDEKLEKDKSPPAPKEKTIFLKEIVKAESSLSKRIFFVIDVSGSMTGEGKIGKGIQFVRSIWHSPVDEFEIAVAVFSDKSTRWEGFPSAKDDPKPAPKGWAKLPSKDAVDAAQKFLNQYPGAGNTYPMPALEMALKEERSDISIVFVTDGDYSDSTQEVLDGIKKLQEEREKKGWGKAVIAIFGVGTAETQKNLSEIGKDYKGGFYVEKPEEKKPPQKDSNVDPPKQDPPKQDPPKQDPSIPPKSDEDPFQGFPR